MATSFISPRSQDAEANTFEFTGHIVTVEAKTYRIDLKADIKYTILHAAFQQFSGADGHDVKLTTTGGDVTGAIHTGKNVASGLFEGDCSGANALVDVDETLTMIVSNLTGGGDVKDLAFTITCRQEEI